MTDFVIKGHICYSETKTEIRIVENGYLVCVAGESKGVYRELPEEYKALPLKDYGNRLIIPGMVDLHIHAPQFGYRGMRMDLELMDWLTQYTFPEEERALMEKNGVYVAHCPASNTNIASGIAPIREFLTQGIRVGLGSDVAGGHSHSMFRALTDTVQASKMYWRYVNQESKRTICTRFECDAASRESSIPAARYKWYPCKICTRNTAYLIKTLGSTTFLDSASMRAMLPSFMQSSSKSL